MGPAAVPDEHAQEPHHTQPQQPPPVPVRPQAHPHAQHRRHDQDRHHRADEFHALILVIPVGRSSASPGPCVSVARGPRLPAPPRPHSPSANAEAEAETPHPQNRLAETDRKSSFTRTRVWTFYLPSPFWPCSGPPAASQPCLQRTQRGRQQHAAHPTQDPRAVTSLSEVLGWLMSSSPRRRFFAKWVTPRTDLA